MARWFSEEALQVAEERKEAKSNGERKRYTQMNRALEVTRGDEKAFLNEQCKEVQGNNIKGKTRDLIKKTGDSK